MSLEIRNHTAITNRCHGGDAIRRSRHEVTLIDRGVEIFWEMMRREIAMLDFVNIPSPRGNVVFNFNHDPIGDLTAFALGYREAANRLAKEFMRSARTPDYAGYPILYLYRHSLELYLKAIVYRGARIMGLLGKTQPEVSKLFKHHGLLTLILPVRAIFHAMQWNFALEESELASFTEFEHFVRRLDSIDSGSYSFRYPIDPGGQAVLQHHLTINIPNFAKIMDPLLGLLEGAAIMLDESFDIAAEAAHEVQLYLAEANEGGWRRY